jgi:UDP-N-acetylmuramate--alanine ligase
VYPAREEPIEGINGKMIADAAKDFGHKRVIYEKDKRNIPQLLNKLVQNDDIVITMGAGDIWKYGEKFIEEYKTSSKK